tara:strand:- start:787 stop:1074 length:288 start_codon:yes stop_codon:yes gene_type:complete
MPSKIAHDKWRVFKIWSIAYRAIDQKNSSGTSVDIRKLEKETAGKVKKVMPAQRYTFFPNISFAIRAQAKLVPACKIGDESLTAHSAFPNKRVVT